MLNKLKSITNYALWAAKYSAVNSCAIVASRLFGMGRKYKDAWLVAELPGEARDNGYWLYEFIIRQHPEVNVFYAINKSSPDCNKLPAKERVIEYGSFQHYLAHVLCSRSISSHVYGASPGRYFCKPFLPLMRKKAEIFLQHGILTKAISLRGYSGIAIYTADIERSLFVKSGHQRPENLKQTGLARFDNLKDTSSKSNILLVMPTFRSYLHNLSHTVSDADFTSSTYYKHWNSLLNNARFLDIIHRHGLKVVFYPHRQMQVFGHLWKFDGDVTIGDPNVHDVQQLLMNSKVLITDYSSTFLDFMYMNKPAVLYQFDKIEVARAHYKELGEYPMATSLTTEKAIIDTVSKLLDQGCKVTEQTAKDIDAFYPYRDTKNRERIFTVISEAN